MAALPAQMSFFTVVGKLVKAVLDGADGDTDPDGVPLQGQLTFSPEIGKRLHNGQLAGGGRITVGSATPPLIVVVDPVPVALLADGSFSVKLLAPDDPDIAPSGWNWTVTFALTGATIKAFSFTGVAGTSVDLANVAPVEISTGGITFVNEAAASAASAAASAASAALSAALVGAPADSAVAALLGNPASATRAAASSTYGRKDAPPKVDAPLLITTPVTLNKNAGNASIAGRNAATGKFYGALTNGHYATSMDLVTWTDKTYSPSTYTPSLAFIDFDATYMYAYSYLGRIWRAPLDVFNTWTEITVTGKGPLTTGRPGSLCALGGGVLVYGNYTSGGGDGAHLWRSTDAGATWAEVLTLAAAKHVHAVRLNPATGVIWASVGDAGWPGLGLYKSTDNGATWTYMSWNEYGIDMVFTPANGRRPALVVLEGDGINRPHLVAFPQDGAPGDKTFPLAWFTGAPGNPDSTRGTTRGIGLTPNGDIIYWTTTEGGTVGVHAGLYVAQAPDFTRTIFLADTTGAEPAGYTRTLISGSLAQLYNWTFPLPVFGAF